MPAAMQPVCREVRQLAWMQMPMLQMSNQAGQSPTDNMQGKSGASPRESPTELRIV